MCKCILYIDIDWFIIRVFRLLTVIYSPNESFVRLNQLEKWINCFFLEKKKTLTKQISAGLNIDMFGRRQISHLDCKIFNINFDKCFQLIPTKSIGIVWTMMWTSRSIAGLTTVTEQDIVKNVTTKMNAIVQLNMVQQQSFLLQFQWPLWKFYHYCEQNG